MTAPRILVTDSSSTPHKIADFLAPAIARVVDLEERGILAQIAEKVRLNRSGYNGIDLVLFLLLFFGQSQTNSLDTFDRRVATLGLRESLAALAGRSNLASRSAVSRMLKSMSPKMLEEIGAWLMVECSGIGQVMRYDGCGSFDCQGQRFDFFDYDPTKTAFRIRALPEEDDLPVARRHTEGFAKEGYSGRKRGEVVLSRGTLQHSGSGAWIDLWLGAGNGESRKWFEEAVLAIVKVCSKVGLPIEQAVMRTDGEFGGVPYISACMKEGIHYLSRLSRYRLFDQEDVRAIMMEATWYEVSCSRSGPRRFATDIGVVTLPAGESTKRSDGTSYEPVRSRVVVSRFRSNSDRGCGHTIDGWTYELYVTDLSPHGWPAEAVVEAYYARVGQENRFYQEDRDYGLDQVKSYSTSGQHFASLIALMLWNMDIARGFVMDPPPSLPQQGSYDAPKTIPSPVLTLDEEKAGAGNSSPEDNNSVSKPLPIDVALDDLKRKEEALRCEIQTILSTNMDKWLSNHPGWSCDPESVGFICPGDQRLFRLFVEISGRKNPVVRFKAPAGTCQKCPLQKQCTNSPRPQSFRRATIKCNPTDVADLKAKIVLYRLLLKEVHWLQSSRPANKILTPQRVEVLAPLDIKAILQPLELKHSVRHSGFLPATARKIHRQLIEQLEIEIELLNPQVQQQPKHPLLEMSKSKRQRRRKTWAERLQRYGLHADADVQVRCYRVPPLLQQIWGTSFTKLAA